MKSENKIYLTIAEFKDIDAPESLLLPSGEILAYPEVLERNFFSIRYKKGKPIFQAGGWVGIIPINDMLCLNVIPKVPINNLERLVFLSNHRPEVLEKFKRRYSPHDYSSKNISEFLIDCLLKHIEEIISSGVVKKFQRNEKESVFPSGKIDFNKTIRLRGKLNDAHVVTSQFERSIDNTPNRFLKKICMSFLLIKEVITDKHRRMSIHYIMNALSEVSDGYDLDMALSDPELKGHNLKESYQDAIDIAFILMSGKGISFGLFGSTNASSLILNLAEVFEWYVLEVLRASYMKEEKISVLDGNKGGPYGGRKALLTLPLDLVSQKKSIMATPDIVLKFSKANEVLSMVIDVKYKSIDKAPDRDDINQIISYTASYSATHGVLIFPANDKNPSGLSLLGELPGMKFYALFIDLNHSNIMEEEAKLASRLESLFFGTLSGYQL